MEDVEQRYPADHYVLVDDKVRILTAVKTYWGSRVTTVFARQGHYAREPEACEPSPPPIFRLSASATSSLSIVTQILAASRPS